MIAARFITVLFTGCITLMGAAQEKSSEHVHSDGQLIMERSAAELARMVPAADPRDVASPEALVRALHDSVSGPIYFGLGEVVWIAGVTMVCEREGGQHLACCVRFSGLPRLRLPGRGSEGQPHPPPRDRRPSHGGQLQQPLAERPDLCSRAISAYGTEGATSASAYPLRRSAAHRTGWSRTGCNWYGRSPTHAVFPAGMHLADQSNFATEPSVVMIANTARTLNLTIRSSTPKKRSTGEESRPRRAARSQTTTAFAAIPDLSTPFVTDLGLISQRCSTSLPE
jgi:hypothetical protein